MDLKVYNILLALDWDGIGILFVSWGTVLVPKWPIYNTFNGLNNNKNGIFQYLVDMPSRLLSNYLP